MKRAKRSFLLCWLLVLSVALPLAQQKPLRAPDVPFDPTPRHVVDRMLKLADVRKSDVLYDLGCGDGRIVIAAAQQFGARGVGIDIDPQRIKESLENARTAGVLDRVTFRNEDLFEADIAEATVVTLFLWPNVNLELRPKLWRDLKPGTRVVSYYWNMGDWVPEKQIEVDGHAIYLWTIPPKRPSGARIDDARRWRCAVTRPEILNLHRPPSSPHRMTRGRARTVRGRSQAVSEPAGVCCPPFRATSGVRTGPMRSPQPAHGRAATRCLAAPRSRP